MNALLGKVGLAALLASQGMKAQDLAASGDAPGAMALLVRMYESVGVSPPSPKAPVSANILTCQVAITLQDGPLALGAAETALAQLRSGAGRYRNTDRAYLDCFCEALVNYCLFWRDQGVVRQVDLSDLDLARVSPRLKWRFPMPEDGTWIGIPSDLAPWRAVKSGVKPGAPSR